MKLEKLLPFNGARRFGADVVDDSIDPMHFINDTVGEFPQEFVGQVSPVGGHAVSAGDGADGHHVFVGAGITHNAYSFYWK